MMEIFCDRGLKQENACFELQRELEGMYSQTCSPRIAQTREMQKLLVTTLIYVSRFGGCDQNGYEWQAVAILRRCNEAR